MKLHTLVASIMFTAAASAPLSAAILTGSGPNLPIPSPNPTWPPGISPTQVVVGNGFTGTWTNPAQPAWVGTSYSATGLIPNALGFGTVQYDFTSLPLGFLPTGTFLIFGDVDTGSTLNERFDLRAFDGSNNVITNEWLGAVAGPNSVHAVRGPGTGTAGAVLPGNMPGWDWNVTNPNSYRIEGATVTGGNPNVAFALVTNQPIHRLRLFKQSQSYGFGLQAPIVPEPAGFAMLLVGAGVACTVLRRRQFSR